MLFLRVGAAALLFAAACAAESPVVGKWNCTNTSVSGSEARWTLLIREDGTRLAGSLSDGEANIPLSTMKFAESSLTFRFDVNNKPYTFAGKVEGSSLEGSYSGDEASGKLRCTRRAN